MQERASDRILPRPVKDLTPSSAYMVVHLSHQVDHSRTKKYANRRSKGVDDKNLSPKQRRVGSKKN